jgi:tetratricopeptide (TPR) repeat protein
LKILRAVHGETHPYIATSLNNIGFVLDSQGKYTEAIARFDEALQIDRQYFGNSHPNVASDLFSLGAALVQQEKYATAIVKLEQALQIYKRFLGENHPTTKAAISWLEKAREHTKVESTKKE